METAPRSDTSRSGSSCEAYAGRGVDRRAGLGDHHLGQVQLRVPADQVGGELVGLPRRGAVADRDQLDLVRRGQPGQRRERRVPLPARLVRVDRVGRDHLAGARRPRPPSPRSAGPGRAPSSAGCRRARRAAGRAGWRRRPGPPRPRPPATAASAGRCRGGSGSGYARPSAPCRPASGRPGRPWSAMPNRAAIARLVAGRAGRRRPSGAGSSGSRVRSRTSSFSPRNMARIRCEGSLVNGSAKSK